MKTIGSRILGGLLFLGVVAGFGLALDWLGGTPIDSGRIVYNFAMPIPAAIIVDHILARRKLAKPELSPPTQPTE